MKQPKNPETAGMTAMFRYLTARLEGEDRRSWKILAVLGLIGPVMDIFSFSVVLLIINRVIRENRASPGLIAFTLCMAGFSGLKCVLELYRSRLSNRFVYGGAQRLSMKIFELLIKEDLLSHNEKSPTQALAMIRQDTTSCIQIIISCLDVWAGAVMLAGYGAVLVVVSGWVGVVSCVALALILGAVYARTRARFRAYGEATRACSIRANAQITIAFGSFKEMKIDDRSAYVLEKYQDASDGYAAAQSAYQYKSGSTGVILQNSVMGALFAVLAVILIAGSNLAAILTPMLAYITALIRALPTAFGILLGLNRIEFAQKPFASLRDSMARYEALKDREARRETVRRRELTFRRGLSVRNLTFGYNRGNNIFEDASIDIPAGCSIAVIGPSGAGKTTFLDLILGLLKPQGGSIFYDDYDLAAQADAGGSCQAGIGRLVSYIPQTVYLNGETIRRNVAFFERDEDIDDGKVELCLRCAQIWEDVQRMPEGVHTLIGENGTAISGGQRQRVALARALYKDFELLVMDEATAALDMETEMAVIDSIRQVKGGKTLLMVTHHMSLANECDYIYKIENRKIVPVKRAASGVPEDREGPRAWSGGAGGT